MAAVMPPMPLGLAVALGSFAAATTAELGPAGCTQLALVLEQARRDFGAVRNERAADALRIRRTRVPAPTLPDLHVIGALGADR